MIHNPTGHKQAPMNSKLVKDIQRLVHPFNFTLSLFLASKYKVRNNHIHPNGRQFQVFCLLLVANSVCVYRALSADVTAALSHSDMSPLEYDFAKFCAGLYFFVMLIGYTIVFILDIFHKKNNIQLILFIQTIHRSFRFKIKSFIIWNWISVVSVISFNIFMIFQYYFSTSYAYILDLICDIFCDVMSIMLDINIVMAIRITILFRKYLDEWMNDVVLMTNEEECQEHSLKMIGVYLNLLEAYCLYKKIFQVLVLYHTFGAFYRNIALFYFMLTSMKYNTEINRVFVFHIITTATWLLKNVFLILIQSINCEKFYISVEEAESVCIQFLKNRNFQKFQERIFKKVLKANKSFTRMTACGLFYVDASLPLSFMAVIAHYYIVILQYSFL